MSEERPVADNELQSTEVYLQRISRDIRELVLLNRELLRYTSEAEAEIPEKVRRFMNYFHDVHDIIYAYEERGLQAPKHIFDEMERLHDRYRQILKGLHHEDGAFAKVRREMAEDPHNRYDHTKQLEFKQ